MVYCPFNLLHTFPLLHYLFFILPLWPPSFYSLSWIPLHTVLRMLLVFSFSILLQGYWRRLLTLTFFHLLHNYVPSILPLVVLPLLWCYSDLFTTSLSLSSPPIIHSSVIIADHPWSSITDTAIPPSLSFIFSRGCLCLLDSLPCCLLTVLAFLDHSPSTL